MRFNYLHGRRLSASHSGSVHSSSTETVIIYMERLKLISASLRVFVSLGLL